MPMHCIKTVILTVGERTFYGEGHEGSICHQEAAGFVLNAAPAHCSLLRLALTVTQLFGQGLGADWAAVIGIWVAPS
jgi:hypothetical protein